MRVRRFPLLPLTAALFCLAGLMLACNLPLRVEPPLPEAATPIPTEPAGTPPPAAPAPAGTAAPAPAPAIPPAPELAATLDKWSLWSDGTQLRGANIWQRVVVPELDGPEFLGDNHVGPPYVQADFDALAAAGANVVNLSHPGLFAERPPYELDEGVQANLDRLLEMAARADLFAVITFRTGPGRSDFTFYSDGASDWFDADLLIESVWTSQEEQDAWVEMWRYTAERYRDNPIVVGYDLMCEPNAESVVLDIWEPADFYPAYAGTLMDWNQFYPRLIDGIRAVDAETPILVGAGNWSGVRWLPWLEPPADPRTVVTVHQYEPQEQYTHQGDPAENSYPGRFDLNWDDEPDDFNRDWLDGFLAPIDDYQREHGVPVAVNEFGLGRHLPGAAEFMADEMDLFEERGVNHALWVWDPVWRPWSQQVNDFNFRYGPNLESSESQPNDLYEAITTRWARNTVRPSTFAVSGGTGASGRSPLAAVDSWLYLLDADLEGELVEQIAASSYDLLVLDFVPSEAGNADFPMAELVDRLHGAPHPKRVLAYIDVGEAEEYRSYWRPEWRVGDPDWIAGDDPDGWQGNYPVAYWRPEWREIWLGPAGIVPQILAAGMDGVYLDWLEAYSDENVIELAAQDGVDPVAEMIRWVRDISAAVRAGCPDCVVIGQNASELAAYDEYLAAIDGIAQEQIWFDGGADNRPAGDCPLPRTEAEVDSEAYRDSLPRSCRPVYADPDSTLHMSSEWYLARLERPRQLGVPILTVDYALEPENVAWVAATSRAAGFVPFASSRGLDRYVEPLP